MRSFWFRSRLLESVVKPNRQVAFSVGQSEAKRGKTSGGFPDFFVFFGKKQKGKAAFPMVNGEISHHVALFAAWKAQGRTCG